MSQPSADSGDLAARLDAAAARLRAEVQPSATTFAPARAADRMRDAMDGLALAEVRVKQARAQLAELEARLGWTIDVRRA